MNSGALGSVLGERRWERLAFLAVVVLSVIWFGWLVKVGFGNRYYTGSARTLSENPQWWFSGALDPAGLITIDKPPVGVWGTALGIAIFGLTPVGIGIANAVMVWLGALSLRHVVVPSHRWLVVLVALGTPGYAILARTTLPDATMLAAGTVGGVVLLRASSWRRFAFAGALFGVAILAKPGAVLMLPAVVVFLVRSARARRFALSVTMGLVGVVLFWVVAASLTPDRPFFGGTTGNTAVGQIFPADTSERLAGGGLTGRDAEIGRLSAGNPGALRLLTGRMGAQAGYLLPLAILGGIGLWGTVGRELRFEIEFWLVWLITHVVVFSSLTGIAHAYYAASIVPAVAVLSVRSISEATMSRFVFAGCLLSFVAASGLLRDRPISYWLLIAVMVVVATVSVLVTRGSSQYLPTVAVLALAAVSLSLTGHTLLIARTSDFDPAAAERQRVFSPEDAELVALIDQSDAEFALLTANEGRASFFVAEVGSSVALWGGFLGRDTVLSEAEVIEMIEAGRIGYVDVSGSRGDELDRILTQNMLCEPDSGAQRWLVRQC